MNNSIIGHDFYSIYAQEYDGYYFIAPKKFKTNGIVRNLTLLKDKAENDFSDKKEDHVELIGIIKDIKLLISYSFNLRFDEEPVFGNGNIGIYLQIFNPETKKYSYFNLTSHNQLKYGKYTVCDCEGSYYTMDDLKYCQDKITTPSIYAKCAEYLQDRYTRKHGYVFELMAGIPFKHKQYKSCVDSLLYNSLYGIKPKNINDALHHFIYPSIETSIQYYAYSLNISKDKNIFDIPNPFNIHNKYKAAAYKRIEKYLKEFANKRMNKMNESMISFQNMKDAI